MAEIKYSLNVTNAQVFAPIEEGWSETVSMRFTEEIPGFNVNKETGAKEAGNVKAISVFTSEAIKTMAATSSNLSAFLSGKTHEEKMQLLPMLLNGAVVTITRELIEEEQKYITTIESVVITDDMMNRINAALDKLFGF